MDVILYVVIIPTVIYSVGRKFDKRYKVGGSRLLLAAACLLFAVSVFIPSPPIHGQDTQFLTHLLGGGVFVGMIWLYFKSALPAGKWYWDLLVLYGMTSALGVLNELYELFAHEIHLKSQSLSDTSWDLFANTLGMLLFYALFRAIVVVKKLFFSR